jgi:hypothetical protein
MMRVSLATRLREYAAAPLAREIAPRDRDAAQSLPGLREAPDPEPPEKLPPIGAWERQSCLVVRWGSTWRPK